MKSYDVIIIGGGPSGIITGVTAIKQSGASSFLMIKEEEKGLVPCGIPYVFHDLKDISLNSMGPKPFLDAGGEVLVDKVTGVDVTEKTVETKTSGLYSYKKLVFATGSVPTVPTFIKGYDLDGVEYIKKSYSCIEALQKRAAPLKDIIIIGGGFIGAEVAEQFARHPDKTVTLVEAEKHCLFRAFSEDYAALADEALTAAGVNVITGTRVEEITGKHGTVSAVRLSDGKTIDADLVISAIGYKPETSLAAAAGLGINKHGAIQVDNYLRTTAADVYAVGDCAATTGFITGRTDNIMLASTATAEARVLGCNLASIRLLRNFAGTLSVFSTELNGAVFASAGAIEQSAREADVDFIVGSFEDVDRHPGTLPGAHKLKVKLIVSPGNGAIIGGEIYGGKSAGEMINTISLAIQKSVTVYELISFQVGTHPLLTNAPTKYVLIKAAENAIAQIKK